MLDTTTNQSRLARLLSFLERDPHNCALLGDAALAAFDEQDFELARQFLERHRAVQPLPPPLLNLQGLVALAERRYQEAIDAFASLRGAGIDEPGIRYNLAWAKANIADYEGALTLLDDEAVAAAPRAPSLKIHVLHHLNRYDDALACGTELAKRFPENQALFGALATLALDAERSDLASEYANKAGNNPEGQAALGFLVLGASDAGAALRLFEESLKLQPTSPRAWVGKGLSLLVNGKPAAAAEAIDIGASLFQNHLGSWIASGWAHFLNDDLSAARQSFEQARSIDPNFSEAHGGLAVLDLLEGKVDAARRNCEIALRLDRNGLGGALAKSLLLEKAGHKEAAQKIRDLALTMPLGPNGQTIASALVAFGSRTGSKPH